MRTLARGLLALVALLLVACGGTVPRAPARLYVSGPLEPAPGAGLAPLAPDSLADRPGAAPLGAGLPIDAWFWSASADGSTLVGVDYDHLIDGAQTTAVVLDARTGAERTRFAMPPQTVGSRLSRDGSRLVVVLPRSHIDPPANEWFVLDTATGRVLSQATIPGTLTQSWLDPAATRLYRVGALTDGLAETMTGPVPLQLVAADLATGAELGRVVLPDVGIGTWPVPSAGQGPAFATVGPAVALSPDGRTLAVLPAESDVLVLVDAERMAVERRVDLGRPWSPLDWLPFWPRLAQAKEIEGTSRQAVFAPDGHTLYAYGTRWQPGADVSPSAQQLPLQAIDVARGRVVAQAAPAETIASLLPAPDSRDLYLLQPRDHPGADDNRDARSYPYVLRRLDAATLAVRAEREMAGFRQLFVLPAD